MKEVGSECLKRYGEGKCGGSSGGGGGGGCGGGGGGEGRLNGFEICYSTVYPLFDMLCT